MFPGIFNDYRTLQKPANVILGELFSRFDNRIYDIQSKSEYATLGDFKD